MIRALLVNDSKSQCILLKQILEKNLIEVRIASTGGIALEMVAAEIFDVVILDWELTDAKGIDLIPKFISSPMNLDIPIIMLTGYTQIDKLQVALDSGAIDFIEKPPDEVNLISRIRVAARIKSLQDRLKEMANRDSLTQLFNRRYFESRFLEAIEVYKRYARPFSFAIIDIDYFKKINDQHGHDMGDLILKQMAQYLINTLRTSDIPARMGGEEFILLFPETDSIEANICMKRILKGIRQGKWGNEPSSINVTVSGGLVTVVTAAHLEFEGLFKQADELLYKSKQAGRDQFHATVIENPSPK